MRAKSRADIKKLQRIAENWRSAAWGRDADFDPESGELRATQVLPHDATECENDSDSVAVYLRAPDLPADEAALHREMVQALAARASRRLLSAQAQLHEADKTMDRALALNKFFYQQLDAPNGSEHKQ